VIYNGHRKLAAVDKQLAILVEAKERARGSVLVDIREQIDRCLDFRIVLTGQDQSRSSGSE
jgi:hypothetical protein